MKCSQHDLKAYWLGELAESERRLVEEHLKGCPECREEWERLRLTESALRGLSEEEPPRKIAFVSDKIFEPGGWAWLWNSAPRLGFASAAVLAAAILVHALVRPAPVAMPVAADTQALEARVESEVAKRLEAVLAKTMAESNAQQARQAAQLVAAAERRMQEERQADRLAFEETVSLLQKKMNIQYRASLSSGGKP